MMRHWVRALGALRVRGFAALTHIFNLISSLNRHSFVMQYDATRDKFATAD